MNEQFYIYRNPFIVDPINNIKLRKIGSKNVFHSLKKEKKNI